MRLKVEGGGERGGVGGGEGDGEAGAFADKTRNISFEDYFENVIGEDDAASGAPGADENKPMLAAFLKFKQRIKEGPSREHSSSPSEVSPPPVVQVKEMSDVKAKIYDQVVSWRREKQKFYFLKT